MNIRELINKNTIEIGAELFTKDEALDRLVKLHKAGGNIRNTAALRREINEREALGNSAVSGRFAIPGVSHSGAQRTGISAITVREGVDYGAPDKRKVQLIFMISGKSNSDEYIEVKSRLMHLLMDTDFTARLCAAQNQDEFMALLSQREKVRYAPPQPDKKYDCSKFLIKNNNKKPRRLFGLFGKRNKTKS